MKNLIILKLGGSVITDRKSAVPKPNLKNIKRLGREISEAYKDGNFDLLLIHGAGSYGHQIVKKTGIDKGIKNKEQALAFAETQRLQNVLNCIVTKALIDSGAPTIPCQASAGAVMREGRLVSMNTNAIKGFLKIGLIPVLYGVPAYDKVQGCSILSGDQIAPFIAKQIKTTKIIHGTNVDGIYTTDPNKDKDAKHIPLITKENFEQVKKYLTGSTNVDVTGGMMGKINEIADLGVETQIVDATKKGRVKQALRGELVGTLIKL